MCLLVALFDPIAAIPPGKIQIHKPFFGTNRPIQVTNGPGALTAVWARLLRRDLTVLVLRLQKPGEKFKVWDQSYSTAESIP